MAVGCGGILVFGFVEKGQTPVGVNGGVLGSELNGLVEVGDRLGILA